MSDTTEVLHVPAAVVVRQLITAAERAAVAEGLRVAIAIVAVSGRLVGLHVMPGTFLSSDAVAEGKAFAAATFSASTRSLLERVTAPTLDRLAAADGRPCFIVGGMPIEVDGRCVGGLGVSGGPAERDEAVAIQALADVFGGG